MKSPYRRAIPISVGDAAIHAAAVLTATAYRAASAETAKRVVNLASEIVDEIEARGFYEDPSGVDLLVMSDEEFAAVKKKNTDGAIKKGERQKAA